MLELITADSYLMLDCFSVTADRAVLFCVDKKQPADTVSHFLCFIHLWQISSYSGESLKTPEVIFVPVLYPLQEDGSVHVIVKSC